MTCWTEPSLGSFLLGRFVLQPANDRQLDLLCLRTLAPCFTSLLSTMCHHRLLDRPSAQFAQMLAAELLPLALCDRGRHRFRLIYIIYIYIYRCSVYIYIYMLVNARLLFPSQHVSISDPAFSGTALLEFSV